MLLQSTFMFLNVLISFHQGSNEVVKRFSSGDEITGASICRTCSCDGNTKTFHGISGEERCIGAGDTGQNTIEILYARKISQHFCLNNAIPLFRLQV